MAKVKRGTGLKLEHSARRETFGFERLPITQTAAPKNFFEHMHMRPEVNGVAFTFNQGRSNTCVAQAMMMAVVLKETRQGLPLDVPARLFPYFISRKYHGSQWFDGGTYIYTLAKALYAFGTPSERFWEFSTNFLKVNRRPNWEAFANAHPRRGGKYVKIYDIGQAKLRAIEQALLNGHDVVFGTALYESFLSGANSEWVKLPAPGTEKFVGNHAMVIIGWMTDETSGKRWYRVLNSWGVDWRNNGCCWMHEDYILSEQTRDLHVVHAWEAVR